MDGSKRSSKANAFFSGFGKRKKVVLYDTLLDQHPPDELVAVLAHEVGHYKKKHILLGMITSVLHVGLLLFLLAQFMYNEHLSLALGAEVWSAQLNIIGFTMLFSPISMFLGIGTNAIGVSDPQAPFYGKLVELLNTGKLTGLDLTAGTLKSQALISFLAVLKENRTTQVLNFKNSNFTDDDIEALSQVMSSTQSVHTFSRMVSSCPLDLAPSINLGFSLSNVGRSFLPMALRNTSASPLVKFASFCESNITCS
jgi:hypothetical protein